MGHILQSSFSSCALDWPGRPNTLGNGWPFGNFARKTAKGQQLFLTLGHHFMPEWGNQTEFNEHHINITSHYITCITSHNNIRSYTSYRYFQWKCCQFQEKPQMLLCPAHSGVRTQPLPLHPPAGEMIKEMGVFFFILELFTCYYTTKCILSCHHGYQKPDNLHEFPVV